MTNKNKAEELWPEPAADYEGLRKQFSAMKNLVHSLQAVQSHYMQKDYNLSESRLAALQEALESERAMNAKLTDELQALSEQQGSPTPYEPTEAEVEAALYWFIVERCAQMGESFTRVDFEQLRKEQPESFDDELVQMRCALKAAHAAKGV